MRLILRVIAILGLLVSIIWLIFVRTFDPIIAFLVSLATFIVTFVGDKKNEVETLDQRNRRIMLNHVEEFWVKGILEKSLYGVSLLELGIKEEPDALNYPWTIKRESNRETLPLGKPMLEIFQEVGLGRTLLILGAPGSGKTTMLLELARQLIERARQNETEPIPIIFNLASWTEKRLLAEWLVDELNAIYSVPKKTAQAWIIENKILLLLDGLDEVQQNCRSKCVDVINQFRSKHGLTCMALCSRTLEYSELGKRLFYDGAIEIQPLTSQQVTAYFNRFGDRLTGIQQALKKDKSLREMAESPLFLSIITLAYKDTQSPDILVSGNILRQRKHLFNTYIERMFERPERAKKERFKKRDVLRWLSWLAHSMLHSRTIYNPASMPSYWLGQRKQYFLYVMTFSLVIGLISGSFILMLSWSSNQLIFLPQSRVGSTGWIAGFIMPVAKLIVDLSNLLRISEVFIGLFVGLFAEIVSWMVILNRNYRQIGLAIRPSWRLLLVLGCLVFFFLTLGLGLAFSSQIVLGLKFGVIFGVLSCLLFLGGTYSIWYYSLRLILGLCGILPWRIFSFLEYSTDLIFLHRVGSGYIFIHRLLMEHFAEMYTEIN